MKTWLLLALLVGAHMTPAEEIPVAQLLSVSGKSVPAPVISVIGGRKSTLTFHLSSSVAPAVSADLFQVSGGVAAPLARALPLKGKEEVVLELEVPAIHRETEMLLILHGQVNGALRKLGQVRLLAFPADFSAEWVKFARRLEEERGFRLGVFGEAVALRDFLRTADVPFNDLGAGIPLNLPDRTVVLGVTSESARDRAAQLFSRDIPGILLISDSPRLPGVYPQVGSRLTVITLPLLSGLTEDPRAQQTLLESLQLITASLKRQP